MSYEHFITKLSNLNKLTNLSSEELEEKKELENKLHVLNNDRRNNGNTVDIFNEFMDRDLTIESFLTIPEIEHMLITAPTQVGKTGSVIKVVEECIKKGISVIVSSDNKTDQMTQIFNRMSENLLAFTANLLKNSNRLEDRIKGVEATPVVFCLDNKSQVNNIRRQLSDPIEKRKKLVIIHDEGDVVTKAGEGYDTNQASESHKAWIQLVESYKNHGVEIKRIFVTATPLNCLSHYPILHRYVVRLNSSNLYKGYNNVHYCGDVNTFDINTLISQEYSALLYVTSRKVESHKEILSSLKGVEHKVFCHTYNGKGVTYSARYVKMTLYLKSNGFVVKTNSKNVNVNLRINELYTICKKLGYKNIVTIGMDLICRGISFVGDDIDTPITASMMLYQPGDDLHNVAINQTIGRLTGTARPDLTRMIYCTHEVYDSYVSYNRNIEYVLNNISGISSDWVANNTILADNGRALDRPVVKLHTKYTPDTTETTTTDNYNDDEGTIDGVQLRLLRKWCEEKDMTVPSRVIHYLLHKENYSVLLETIAVDLELTKYNIADISSKKANSGKLLCRELKNVKLNPKLVQHILEFTGQNQ